MAVYSMTGYASASAQAGADEVSSGTADNLASRAHVSASGQERGGVSVELRSVNGRFLDLGFRLPDEFRSLEPALRDLLTGNFRRGKIELRLNTKTETDTAWQNPQPEQMNRLSHLESTIQGWLPKAQALSVHEVMQWCKGGAPAERLDEVALDAAKRCVAGLAEARAREGEKLVAVLMDRIK